MVTRWAHNPEITGSIPVPATKTLYMKNLLRKFSLEEIEWLPVNTLSLILKKSHRAEYDRWRARGSEYHPIDNIYPYKRVHRLIEYGVGKPFDEIFSKYCSQVPRYQQHIFLEEFKPEKKYNYRGIMYYVDDEGLIRKKIKERYSWRRKKEKRVFYSDDYKTEMRHKITGKKKPEYSWWDKRTHVNDEDYEPVVISGWSKEYKTNRDREFMRLKKERFRQYQRQRKLEKEKREKEFLEKLHLIQEKEKERKRLEKERDMTSLIKHGFDPTTSFRGRPEE